MLLGVPPSRLKAIQASKGQGGVQQWKVDMFQAWLDNKLDASWEDIVSALKQLENLRLATKLKKKYLMKHSQENSQGKILSAWFPTLTNYTTSLVPRLSPRMTMTAKLRWYPFAHDPTEWTPWRHQYVSFDVTWKLHKVESYKSS